MAQDIYDQTGRGGSRNSVNDHRKENSGSSSDGMEAPNLQTISSVNIRSKPYALISAEDKSTGNSSLVSSLVNVTTDPRTEDTNAWQNKCPLCGSRTSIRIRGWDVFHLPTALQNLSADESMFVSDLYNWGLDRARQ